MTGGRRGSSIAVKAHECGQECILIMKLELPLPLPTLARQWLRSIESLCSCSSRMQRRKAAAEWDPRIGATSPSSSEAQQIGYEWQGCHGCTPTAANPSCSSAPLALSPYWLSMSSFTNEAAIDVAHEADAGTARSPSDDSCDGSSSELDAVARCDARSSDLNTIREVSSTTETLQRAGDIPGRTERSRTRRRTRCPVSRSRGLPRSELTAADLTATHWAERYPALLLCGMRDCGHNMLAWRSRGHGWTEHAVDAMKEIGPSSVKLVL